MPKARQRKPSKRNLHEPLGPLPTLVVIRTHAADRRAHENPGSCKCVAGTGRYTLWGSCVRSRVIWFVSARRAWNIPRFRCGLHSFCARVRVFTFPFQPRPPESPIDDEFQYIGLNIASTSRRGKDFCHISESRQHTRNLAMLQCCLENARNPPNKVASIAMRVLKTACIETLNPTSPWKDR